jgi:hypothetical protein
VSQSALSRQGLDLTSTLTSLSTTPLTPPTHPQATATHKGKSGQRQLPLLEADEAAGEVAEAEERQPAVAEDGHRVPLGD